MKLNSNTVIIIVGTLLIAGGLYWFLTSGGSDQPPVAAGTENPAQAQFNVLVSQLQPISFTTSIFSDPNFMALVDLSTPVTPEPAGKLDPFAPLH